MEKGDFYRQAAADLLTMRISETADGDGAGRTSLSRISLLRNRRWTDADESSHPREATELMPTLLRSTITPRGLLTKYPRRSVPGLPDKSRPRFHSLCALLFLVLYQLTIASSLTAAEGNSDESRRQQDLSLNECVERLGSASYQQREAAAEELLNSGAAALPALLKAITSDDSEIAWRVAELVEQIAINEDEQVLLDVSSKLLAVAQSQSRDDLARRATGLQKLWKQHRTASAIQRLQEKGAEVVVSQQISVSGGVGGAFIIDGRVVVTANEPAAASEPVEINMVEIDPKADWLDDPALAIPATWLEELAQAETKVDDENERVSSQSLFAARRLAARRKLISELGEVRSERLTMAGDPEKELGILQREADQAGEESADELQAQGALELGGEGIVIRGGFGGPVIVEEAVIAEPLFMRVGIDAGDVRQSVSNSVHITLGEGWTGSVEELQLLQQIDGLQSIRTTGTKLEPEMWVEFALLDGLRSLTLDKSEFETEWVKAFSRARPHVGITLTGPAYLGVNANVNGDETVQGCEITNVVPESAAAKAGLKVGDIVVRINDQPVTDFFTLTASVANKSIGEAIEVEVVRGGSTIVTRARLGDRALQGR